MKVNVQGANHSAAEAPWWLDGSQIKPPAHIPETLDNVTQGCNNSKRVKLFPFEMKIDC